MRTRRIAAAVLVTFLASSAPLTAVAQDDPVTVQARARFKEGVDFYDKGQYENARLAFLQAYALKKHPAVLLNLAQSTAKANHPLEAAKYFQQFLKEATTATPQQKQDAENGLAEVRQKLGRIEIIAPAGTEITLDEKERLGTTPFAEPIDVEPGAHALKSPSETVRVTANAGQKVQARFGGGGGAAAAPAVAPIPPPATSTPSTPPQAEPEAAPSERPPGSDARPKHTNLLTPPANMTPVYIGLAAAGVGIAGAIIFAAFKSDAQTKADSVANEIRRAAGPNASGVCNRSDAATVQRFGEACTTLRQNMDKVDTNAAIANVSLVVMGLGLATAAGWYLFAPKREDAATQEGSASSKAVAPKPPELVPYAGYGNGGFVFSGEF
ncbi:MAG: hypothetical protein KF819_32530 [Labilithrix sp.]|nr:hypothetical protein [Labilithrix sp.]